MVRVVLFGLLLIVAGCATRPETEGTSADEQLRALYEREFAWRQDQEGYLRGEDGDWERGPAWPDVSPEAQARRLAYWERALGELAAIPRDALSEDEQVNAAVFEEIVSALASKYPDALFAVVR